jgi:2-keto-4-pentenoate hydratase/2-oxohepta-3-ene-1,7-dioic acid hydratase in catechol pathway
MKFATIKIDGELRVAEVDSAGGRLRPLPASLGAASSDLRELIRDYDAIRGQLGGGDWVPIAGVQIEAPIPRPARNIFCVGKNYHAHAHEFARSGFDSSVGKNGEAIPDFPIIFSKVPECVVADGAPIRYPVGASDQLDYEAEIALIIGKGGRGISKADAFNHVWGYTIINDVTARDLQARHKQWLIGKSLDTFGPMGPYAVTADELDAENLNLKCWVNGELRQEASTADLIFDIPTLIETLSAGITLEPGDIIATGTPAGVGIGFDPPRFLVRGDTIAIEVEGIGRLTNTVQ